MRRLIRLLENEAEYVSGEKISLELGVTRSGVWKKIEALRKKGFVIHAVPSRGYRIVGVPDLSAEYISARISRDFWKDVLLYEIADSTNELADLLWVQGRVETGTIIIADSQVKGRGRLGRKWSSPPGLNIYMSIILVPRLAPKDMTLLTVLSAVACANALRRKAAIPVWIKWPNDLMSGGKKIGGILTEVKSDPDKINLAVIGVGINVNIGRADFDHDIREIATSVAEETGRLQSRSGLVVQVLNEFEYWYRTFETEGRTPLLEEWRRLSSTIGKHVMVTMGTDVLNGVAEAIDDEGMLLLRLPDGRLKKISAGDVTELR
jgi:BirA family biotin operon repressor/biotin-[acetyl-CoA-carboxylase] ligase